MPKIAVITGAGAGVGRATAREFARQGFDVALLSRDPARLENAADEVRRHGMRALPIPTDIADAAAMEAAADRVEAELGPIDVWVNVAMATVFSPGLLDRYLAKAGYSGQLADQPVAPDAPANLFESVPGDYSAHGRFDDQARDRSWEMFTNRHKMAVIAVVAIGLAAVAHQTAKYLDI